MAWHSRARSSYSLHPILKKLELEQGGLNIFRRFRIVLVPMADFPTSTVLVHDPEEEAPWG